MKIIIIGIVALIVSGCATSPPSLSDVRQVPRDRLLAYQDKTEKTTASITVIRDSGFIGGGCFYALSIDGRLAARLDTAEMAKFYVEPGELLLKSSSDPEGKGLCGAFPDEFTQRETILRPNEIKTFRLSIDANGKTDISRSER